MKRLWLCLLLCLVPASALAQGAPPSPPSQPTDVSRLWFVAGAGSGTLRGHCNDCVADFPFRHGPAIVGNAGYRVSERLDVGADLFWMQWTNDSGKIRATAYTAVAQFRPWSSQGFFLKGGAGMALVRNWVRTTGSNPDDSMALAVVFGGGWEFHRKKRVGYQLFASQHVGALGDLQTVNGQINDVTGNFWALGAAIVIR